MPDFGRGGGGLEGDLGYRIGARWWLMNRAADEGTSDNSK